MPTTNEDILAAIKRMQGNDGNGNAVTLAVVKERQESFAVTLAEVCKGYKTDHDRLGKVESKVGLFAGLQAGFTAAAAILAGWLGMQK